MQCVRKLASYVILISWTLLIHNLKLDLFVLINLVYSVELLTDFSYKPEMQWTDSVFTWALSCFFYLFILLFIYYSP